MKPKILKYILIFILDAREPLRLRESIIFYCPTIKNNKLDLQANNAEASTVCKRGEKKTSIF